MMLLAAGNNYWLQIVFEVVLGFMGLFLILLVLVQRGRGGGLTGALGGMGGQSAFGAKAGDLFTRITIVVAAVWIVVSMFAVVSLGKSSQIDAGRAGPSSNISVPGATGTEDAGTTPDGKKKPADGLSPPADTKKPGEPGLTPPSNTPEKTAPEKTTTETTTPEKPAPAPEPDAAPTPPANETPKPEGTTPPADGTGDKAPETPAESK